MGKGTYTGTLPTKKPRRKPGEMRELNRRLGEWMNTHTMHTLSKPALQILLGFSIRGRWDTCQWRCGHKAIATQFGAAPTGVKGGTKGGVDPKRISLGFKELIEKGIVIMIKKRHEHYSATYEITDPAKVLGGVYYHDLGGILSRLGGVTITPLTNIHTSIYEATPHTGGAAPLKSRGTP
jgi:hypothetical protein